MKSIRALSCRIIAPFNQPQIDRSQSTHRFLACSSSNFCFTSAMYCCRIARTSASYARFASWYRRASGVILDDEDEDVDS